MHIIFMFSGVHDHSNSHCFMKIMNGQLKETLYAWPHNPNVEEPLAVTDTNIYKNNEVTYICGKVFGLCPPGYVHEIYSKQIWFLFFAN